MAYQQKTWQSGEVITSAALNNIESGIGELIQHNKDMANSFTSDKLEIGSGDTLIKGENGVLSATNKITAPNLEIATSATFSGTVSIQTPTADAHAVTKGYADGKFALKETKITASTGLSGGGDLSKSIELSLKEASAEELGGIKVGNGLSISNGTLSTNAISLASDNSNGLMSATQYNKLDKLKIKVDEDEKHNQGQDANNIIDISSHIVNSINIYGEGPFRPNGGTANLKGVVTGVKVNNTEINAQVGDTATSGLIDIGNVVRSIKVNNTEQASTDGVVNLTIPDVSGKLNAPDLPEDDGTYTLQLTLNQGTATYAWVAVSTSGGEGT